MLGFGLREAFCDAVGMALGCKAKTKHRLVLINTRDFPGQFTTA